MTVTPELPGTDVLTGRWLTDHSWQRPSWTIAELEAAKGGRTISVVLPALNEEVTVGSVVETITPLVGGLVDELIVLDSGSTDDTEIRALAAGARVISREVDPDAEFAFVSEPADVPADATPFAIDGAEFLRHIGPDGNECAVEKILRRYELIDPTLWRIAEIVHEAVLQDERYFAPEARGLDALVSGLALVGNGAHTLTITGPLFDGLYKRFYYRDLLGQPRV